MLLDVQNIFSDAQAVTETVESTNYINLGAPATVPGAKAPISRDLGASDISLLVQVVETFEALSSLTVSIESDNNSNFISPKTVATSGAVGVASLVAGYRFSLSEIPLGTNGRYIRLKYTVGGSNATAGKVTAGIVSSLSSIGR